MNFESIGLMWAPRMLSVLRIMSGLLFLEHGTGKFLHFPAGTVAPTFTIMSMSGYAGFFEFFCGILLVIGLFTRPAAFLASGMCAVGYFLVHAPMGFFPVLNHGETIVLYCFVFLYLAAAGAGPWSVDAMMKKK